MKMVKKIALASIFAVLACTTMFARGKKDSGKTETVTEEQSAPVMTEDPGFQK